MQKLEVFDPAMCCSTGICGPSVDPELVRFAADLDWLKGQGVSVVRFNLSQEPGAFAGDAAVKSALEAKGEAALPLVKANGEVKSSGTYPSREELASWAGFGGPAPSLYTDAVAELVAIGAAVASNCEPCFKFHYDKARRLGVSREDMLRAVATAQAVKETPAKAVTALADRYLRRDGEGNEPAAPPEPSAAKSGGCCSRSKNEGAPTRSGRCC